MKSEDTPLHGSYFDLAAAKHPDLKNPDSGRRSERPRAQRRRFKALPIVLCAGLVGVVWLAVASRPEKEGHRIAGASSPAAGLETTPRASAAAGSSVAERAADSSVAEQAAGSSVAEQAAETPLAPPARRVESAPAPLREPVAEEPLPESVAVAEAPVENVAVSEAPVGQGEEERLLENVAVAEAPAGQGEEERLLESVTVAATATPPPVVPARKIFAPAPEYPDAAQRAGEEGTVVVETDIDATGAVTGAVVVRGRSPALDAAAVAAIESWRFEPATRAGVPVATSKRIGVTFAFDEQAQQAAPGTTAAPLEVGGEVQPPRRLAAPLPDYPDAAWAQGVRGEVRVRAVIDENGEVAAVEVLRGLPHGLTEAAVASIRRWKFAPATLGGRPVAVYRNLSVRFEG